MDVERTQDAEEQAALMTVDPQQFQDPMQKLLFAQLQQNNLLMQKIMRSKTQDPALGALVSGGGDNSLCNGTLDQVQAIALVRAFDPGAWVRIAFDVKSVASLLRGEPFVRSILQSGQTSQLVFARTFSDLNNCLVSTVMEHISNFLRAKFDIDVPPDYLSVHLPHDVPLPGHYSLLELTFLCDILDGDMMAFREQRTLLLLRVTTTVPVSVLTSNGVSCLS